MDICVIDLNNKRQKGNRRERKMLCICCLFSVGSKRVAFVYQLNETGMFRAGGLGWVGSGWVVHSSGVDPSVCGLVAKPCEGHSILIEPSRRDRMHPHGNSKLLGGCDHPSQP